MAETFNPNLIPEEKIRVVELKKLPRHDTIWDLCMMPDDTLYIGACAEYTGGMSAWLCTYHPLRDEVEYLDDLEFVTGERNDSGHPTQGKIHFSLCYDDDGIVYGATHCTTAPMGEKEWPCYTFYADSIRSFPGAHLFAHNPKTMDTRDLGIITPREGVRVMVIDRKRRVLHGTTYPKNHYFIYDLDKRRLEDLGRIGMLHQLALFLDDDGNGYTTDNFGQMIRCDAETHKLTMLDAKLPHYAFGAGEHNILLQAVRRPGTDWVYGSTYTGDGRIYRFNLKTHEMCDLGPGYGVTYDPVKLAGAYPGGMSFGRDGCLYYTIRDRFKASLPRGHLIRRNVETGEQVDLGLVAPKGVGFTGGSCHGKSDSLGNIYFTQNSATPPRFYIYKAGE